MAAGHPPPDIPTAAPFTAKHFLITTRGKGMETAAGRHRGGRAAAALLGPGEPDEARGLADVDADLLVINGPPTGRSTASNVVAPASANLTADPRNRAVGIISSPIGEDLPMTWRGGKTALSCRRIPP